MAMVHHTLYSEAAQIAPCSENTQADDGDMGDDNEDQEEMGMKSTQMGFQTYLDKECSFHT